MRRSLILPVVIGLLCASVAPVYAMECDVNVTMSVMFDKTAQVLAKAEKQQVEKSTQQTLTAATNNPASTSNPGQSKASTITDFISLISVSGLGGSVLGDSITSDDDAIKINYNLQLGERRAGTLALSASLNRNPVINPALLDSLDATVRTTFEDTYASRLDPEDDITFSLTYNFGLGKFGARSLDTMEQAFLGILGGVESEDLQPYRDASENLKKVIDQARENNPSFDPGSDLLSTLNEPSQKTICQALAAFIKAEQDLDKKEDLTFEETKFSELVSNQPQFFFSVNARERDQLVGPDELSVKLTYEWGFRATFEKMLAASKSCNGSVDPDCAYQRFKTYVSDNEASIAASDRFKLSLEYSDVDDFQYEDALVTTAFSKPGVKKTLATFGYGRALPSSDLLNNARIDFELKYEDVGDDPDRQARTIGLLTLTNTLQGSGNVSMPFTLLYSNKSEFVADNTDDKISAHIGLKWKMMPPE